MLFLYTQKLLIDTQILLINAQIQIKEVMY